jgi:hypothetical protein
MNDQYGTYAHEYDEIFRKKVLAGGMKRLTTGLKNIAFALTILRKSMCPLYSSYCICPVQMGKV